MATLSKAIHTRILVDGYRISSETNKAVVKMDADKTEITCFEDTAASFVVNDPKPSIELGGYITHSTNPDTFEAIAAGALEAQVTVTVIKSSTATITGGVAYTIPSCNAITLSHDLQVAGVMTMNATWGGAVAMKRGKCAYGGAAIAATGAKPAIDLGAAGTTGGFAYLHVTGITGTATSATVDVESSDAEAGTYASEGTFTFSAIGVQALALTGTVNRWVRINCTSLGGATNFTVHAVVAVNGVTQ
jgi:hypothetical protein